MEPQGCPIGEDLASDVDVNKYWDAFVKAKISYELNGVNSILEKAYRDLELIDSIDELVQLEMLYREIKNKRGNDKKWNKVL